jgi:hypothetical protein
VCTRVGKQQSRGVLNVRFQCRDLHQSTYLYLTEDRDSTSPQVVSDFRLPMRYYRMLSS